VLADPAGAAGQISVDSWNMGHGESRNEDFPFHQDRTEHIVEFEHLLGPVRPMVAAYQEVCQKSANDMAAVLANVYFQPYYLTTLSSSSFCPQDGPRGNLVFGAGPWVVRSVFQPT
jgi:hypothetical protein